MKLPKPTHIERLSGSLTVEVGLTAFGASYGGALAPLLPILAKSLGAERQRLRVEKSLLEIAAVLERHEEAIVNLTDEQYKLINETVLTLLQTTQEKKLRYLRTVVENTLSEKQILPEEATMLSRVVRDISAEEIAFLLRSFQYDGVLLTNSSEPEKDGYNYLHLIPNSSDALNVSGLISLGLVESGETMWIGTPLRFNRISGKLIALLQDTRSSPLGGSMF